MRGIMGGSDVLISTGTFDMHSSALGLTGADK